MIEIDLSHEGIMAWLGNDPPEARKQKLRTMARKAQKEAVTQWTALAASTQKGLAYRFDPSAFTGLNLTPRSRRYQTQQIKSYLGAVTPYVAPKDTVSKSGSVVETGSMKRAVTGGGFSIVGRNKSTDVTTVLAITGARILNEMGDAGQIYRDEFLGFDGGGKRDAEWIQNRTQTLLLQYMIDDMARASRRRTKVTSHAE